MKKIFTLIALFLIGVSANAQSNFDGIFISEYVEGASNNKAIEIYNGSRGNTSIALNRLRIRIFANGAGTAGTTITLGTADDASTTSLSFNSTFVVYHTSFATPIATTIPNCPTSRRRPGNLGYNGDDAVDLQVDTTGSGDWKTVDIFGKIGEDPGVAWTSGSLTSLDASLERKSTINTGVITNPSSFDATIEWLDNANITTPITTLGAHTTNSPLPISLVKFEAEKLAEKVKISWTTATEINNDKFIVERSSNGNDFELVSEIKGAGNSKELNSYELIDENPLKGTSYYRLTQIDFDGRSESFAPVAVKMNAKSLEVQAWSASEGTINLNVYSPSNTTTEILIRDLSGRTIVSEKVNLTEGYQKLNIDANILSSGVHFIQLMNAEGVVMKKLVL